MGVEQSRASQLPVNLNDNYESYKKNWHIIEDTYKQEAGISTLGKQTLTNAAITIREYFADKSSLSILEIMAGNGHATDIVYDELKDYLTLEKWTSTEIQNLPQTSNRPIIFGCDSVDAVTTYGTNHDTLLMISPPPLSRSDDNGYGDYFAVKKWTELNNSKYIIFVGELGASDGSEGMYKYMMEHPVWKCVERKMACSGLDLFGGRVEKEIFIFARTMP